MLRTTIITATLLSVGLLSACGLTATQRDAAGQFAKASANLGSFASDEFPKLRNAVIEMNMKNVALGVTSKGKDLDGPFDVTRTTTRVKAAEHLSKYGQLLQALVQETQEQELKDASDAFVSSASNIPGLTLNEKNAEAAGAIVQRIGGWFIELKKCRAVKKIVPDHQEDVDKIINLLIADFTVEGNNLASGVESVAMRLQGNAEPVWADPDASVSDRFFAIKGKRLAEQHLQRLNTVESKAVKALEQLKKANGTLVAALEKDASFEDIKALGKQVNELADAVKVLTD